MINKIETPEEAKKLFFEVKNTLEKACVKKIFKKSKKE